MQTQVQKRILIALPNAAFADRLKKYIETKGFTVVDTVVIFEHLIEAIENCFYNGSTLDGLIIASEIAKKGTEKNLELLSDTLLTIRNRYNFPVVFLSDERIGHPLLAELVNMGIYDIILRDDANTSLDVNTMMQAFIQPTPFASAMKFREVDTTIQWRKFYNAGHALTVTIKTENGEKLPNSPIIQENIVVKEVPVEVVKEVKVEVPVEKEVIREVEKERLVEKLVEVPKVIPIPPKVVAVVSLYPQVGSTFFTDNFSLYLSEHNVPIGVVETNIEMPIWSQMLDGFAKRPHDWKPWITQVKNNGSIRQETAWQHENIYYMPIGENALNEISDEDALRLFYLTKNIPVMFADIGSALDSPISRAALAQADEVWLVTAPDPIQINIHMEKKIGILKRQAPNGHIHLIGNKWCETIEEYVTPLIIKEQTGFEMIATIPEMSHLTLPSAWTGEKVIKTESGNELLEEPFRSLSERILPEQFIRNKPEKKRWGWFSSK
ncbi:hypothetical protein [Aneurinibacillus tyrosinisolvens]|uniref:hypothetical protein n=1 Tax=Aneurinibacillus tyrosinisolvens TaxID=1443435 RepID=UPI00063F7801|nr:hypothetical protein [Aneurinibacillus tyrosinisolvens]